MSCVPRNLHQVSMANLSKKKVTWVIKNFSSLESKKICSDHFVIGGCKWHLAIYPKITNVDYLPLYLEIADYASLPIGWRVHAKFTLTVVNQRSAKLSLQVVIQEWFEQKAPGWGNLSVFPLKQLHAKDSGFLADGELKVVVEIDVLEIIGNLDVSEETVSTIMETIDVNGFQLLPSQAKSVSRIFERHPEIASGLRPKNANLRTGYMSLLLSLIETMCQLPQEISKDDLYDAYAALGSMRDAGFKLDWLEEKLDEVLEKKAYEEAIESGLQGMEEELKNLKLRCSDMEAFVEKEKEKVTAAKAPLSFDDVV